MKYAAPLAALLVAALGTGSAAGTSPFAQEMAAAMARMMAAMQVSPTGDIDRDFAAQMTPHHQGAIDMALAELKYGHNTQMKRIAQEIIIDQQQEIAAMHLALGQPLAKSSPAPTVSHAQSSPEH